MALDTLPYIGIGQQSQMLISTKGTSRTVGVFLSHFPALSRHGVLKTVSQIAATAAKN